jgi:hypothetical protein
VTEVRHFTLDLEVGTEPIAGRLSEPGGEPAPFAGWLELAAALERAVRPDPPEPERPA